MAAGGSGLGVALAGAFLRDVDAAVDLVDLVAVAAAGALVGYVAGLLKALVDLLVVLVGDSMSFRCRRIRIPVCSAGPVRRCTPTPRMAGPVTTSARTSAWSASSARLPRNGPPTTRPGVAERSPRRTH
jgi:hypothetical protein